MECPVCYSETASLQLCCGHSLCKDCAHQWFQKAAEEPTCPMCREPMTWKGMHKVKADWEEERVMGEMEELWEVMFDDVIDFFGHKTPHATMTLLKDIEKRFNMLKNDTDCDVDYMEFILSIPFWMPDVIKAPKDHLDHQLYLRSRRPFLPLGPVVSSSHRAAPIMA